MSLDCLGAGVPQVEVRGDAEDSILWKVALAVAGVAAVGLAAFFAIGSKARRYA